MTNNQENFLLLELSNVGFVSIIFLLSPKLLMILILEKIYYLMDHQRILIMLTNINQYILLMLCLCNSIRINCDKRVVFFFIFLYYFLSNFFL